jgi:glycosyltransferase involved in cell wall biosynthesis
MLISVILPIYNSGKTALAAINSVYSQTDIYKYEIIVVDDCSSDDSVAFLKSQVKGNSNFTIKYILHDVNKGSGAARNTGIKEATGKYFAMLDSDDIWLDGKIASQIDFLESHPDYVMIGCLTNMPGSFIPPFASKKEQLIDIKVWHQCFKCFLQPSTVVIRTEHFKRSVVWPDMRYGDEGDAFIRLAFLYKICLQNKVLVNYANGKRGFGYTGVSKRLIEMQEAEVQNLRMAYRNKYISLFIFLVAISFSYIKYFKRIIITKVRQ